MEFLILKHIRDICGFSLPLFLTLGKNVSTDVKNVRLFVKKLNDNIAQLPYGVQFVKNGDINAAGLINEIFHIVCESFRAKKNPDAFVQLLQNTENVLGKREVLQLLTEFGRAFPSAEAYRTGADSAVFFAGKSTGTPHSVFAVEDILLLHLAVENPAFKPFAFLFDDKALAENPNYAVFWEQICSFFKTQPVFGPNHNDLVSMLKEPVKASPNSLKGQLEYIRRFWGDIIGDAALKLLSALDIIAEEEKAAWMGGGQNFVPPMQAYSYENLMNEYERFSPDTEWMPRVVLMAKTVLVWLNQLSKKYRKSISRLDEIPDEELDMLASRGFTGLWLIGVWRRSQASRRIKQINGNAEAAASAYSLDDYDIAEELGGWEALGNLRARLWRRGIRLAADMVPNHTGMDSKWIIEKPHLFIQRTDNPFPSYSFNGENLCPDQRVQVFLEDKYYSKSDCAVVFKRLDTYTGDVRYIYHGNDGTGLPWNDTAQIDFLNPEAREEVIQKILHVARNFPIIRFDAAMVLAKKHIRRLWYPEPGCGGDIASRSESAIGIDDFEKAIPNEFWREVVDRVAREIPDTLLLAEAFWMMEGYFVRTLGMHRVYNSAFMNMLKKEENYKYRSTIKNTIEFDPQVLKRFVNFMNNPDEETASVQFGKGDKYFGVCTLMVTMPGLPMFGHGQIEGFNEKYGMEFTRAYWDEIEDGALIERHNREIFPLIKKRCLFSDVEHFRLYDVWNNGSVNENVFAYTNRSENEATAVFYNNVYERSCGWIKTSCRYAVKNGGTTVLHTEDFASALNLTNADGYYCIFSEQRSALRFIRSNKELFEKGMFIQLNGFECQVLWDIREVRDDESGTYRLLCESLGGRGTADMDAALEDLCFKDLYEPLSAFASKDFFAALGALCLPRLQSKDFTQVPSLQELLKQSEKPARMYFKALHTFFAADAEAAATVRCVKKMPEEKMWQLFCGRIKTLVYLAEQSASAKAAEKVSAADPLFNCAPPSGKTAGSAYSRTERELISGFFQELCGQAFIPQVIGAHCIILCLVDMFETPSITDADILIDLWKIERKIIRLLNEYGYPARETQARLVRMRELHVLYEKLHCRAEKTPYASAAKCTQKEGGAKKMRHGTALLAEYAAALIHSRRAPLILGVNMFENVLWFNRELAFETSWTACMLFAMETGAEKGQTEALAALNHALALKQEADNAVQKSGYKAEELPNVLHKGAVKKALPEKRRGVKKG